MSNDNESKVSRRDLLKTVALTGAALSVTGLSSAEAETGAASMVGVKFEPHKEVRLAIIGLGERGGSMLGNYLGVENVRVTALCDIVPEKVKKAQAEVEKAGQKTPAAYTNGEHDFENLARRDDIDFVYIATPWEWHVPMALAALNNGKHAGSEVPAATSIEDCWKLVNASERNRRHCLIMENCCYGYNEMLVNRMVHEGALGELLHAEGAYLHDLRELLFSKESEGLWRRAWHTRQNGNLYPTHGLGPVAWYFDINRGDRFDHMVSMSSQQAGLTAYRQEHVPHDDPRWNETYKCGDMNTSLIQTAKGKTIMVQHDTCNPRPYSRLNMVSGTKGVFHDYPPRVYFDGQSPEDWTGIDELKAKYEHPLWTTSGEVARKMGGHGGMDYVMVYRLMQCMQQGLAPDLDVYDAAAWSAPFPLSVQSVAQASASVKFPDFTRGKWSQPRT